MMQNTVKSDGSDTTISLPERYTIWRTSDIMTLQRHLSILLQRDIEAEGSPPCLHHWVNVGFMHIKMVCATCDQEMK